MPDQVPVKGDWTDQLTSNGGRWNAGREGIIALGERVEAWKACVSQGEWFCWNERRTRLETASSWMIYCLPGTRPPNRLRHHPAEDPAERCRLPSRPADSRRISPRPIAEAGRRADVRPCGRSRASASTPLSRTDRQTRKARTNFSDSTSQYRPDHTQPHWRSTFEVDPADRHEPERDAGPAERERAGAEAGSRRRNMGRAYDA